MFPSSFYYNLAINNEMSGNNLDELRGDYDKCIEKVNDLTSLIKLLSN